MNEVRKKILCIEHDRDTARLIANELSQRGFYALIAYDARVGLAAILKRIPDLVLCDVSLPEMSGFEILTIVNGAFSRYKRVPFILLAGSAGRDDELRGRILGADDYLTRPFDFDILEEIIRARLIKGVVRHGMAESPVRMPNSSRRQVLGRRAAPEQIVELKDAPTVDLHLDHARSMGTIDESDGSLRVMPGSTAKP